MNSTRSVFAPTVLLCNWRQTIAAENTGQASKTAYGIKSPLMDLLAQVFGATLIGVTRNIERMYGSQFYSHELTKIEWMKIITKESFMYFLSNR
jgi:hypothetical protein